ncbi:MAG: SIMPL domain-containing protein [Cytophagales bacterium]|nr:SIMPL domain-containing protein [Armatimonadota bacterium]
MESPDTGIITVTVSQESEVEADHADLFVSVRGSSLFTGKAALSKAREVAQLVADLKVVGVGESSIQLQGVRADVSSGVLGKTSSATYSLKVRCARLDLLADILGAITGQKNALLKQLAWGYGDGEDRRLACLDDCIARANAKAGRIATGLGIRLLGIAHFTEAEADPESGARPLGAPMMMEMSRARASTSFADDLGMEVSHAKTVTLTVTVGYRVSDFKGDAPQ